MAQTGVGVVVAVLKQQKCIVSQIWRPEVREQVSSRLDSNFRTPLLGFSMVLFSLSQYYVYILISSCER